LLDDFLLADDHFGQFTLHLLMMFAKLPQQVSNAFGRFASWWLSSWRIGYVGHVCPSLTHRGGLAGRYASGRIS
jgi:hypothetical protein